MALDDLVGSLDSANDLLLGADSLLGAEVSPARSRSAQALVAMAADLVGQAAQLARALSR